MHITLEGWLLEVGINDGNAIGVLLGDDVLLGDSEGLTSNTFVLQFPQDLELKTKCIGIIRMVSLRHLHLINCCCKICTYHASLILVPPKLFPQ